MNRAFLLLAATCLSCAPAAPPQPERPAPTTPAPTGSAILRGTVRLDGPAPAAGAPIRMGSDPACAAVHPGGVAPELYVVDATGALANVAVRITGGLPEGIHPEGPSNSVLDQRGCVFTPHVILVRAGRPLVVRNSDPTLHNVRAKATANDSFNLGLPAQGQEAERTFRRPEIVTIKCDVHPWMTAYAIVTDHPYAAVTDASGRWEIRGLPAGSYSVEAWHEKLGTRQQEVQLADAQEQTLDFKLSP